MEKTICELFAGVGGVGLGFERVKAGGKQYGFHNGNLMQKNNGRMIVMCDILGIVWI